VQAAHPDVIFRDVPLRLAARLGDRTVDLGRNAPAEHRPHALRRCTLRISRNRAGRNGDAEFAHFCSIAMGSASELEYHQLPAKDLNLIKPKDHAELSQRPSESAC
jgi:four helix bundle protein